jgi:hypothetical protein
MVSAAQKMGMHYSRLSRICDSGHANANSRAKIESYLHNVKPKFQLISAQEQWNADMAELSNRFGEKKLLEIFRAIESASKLIATQTDSGD